MFKTDCINRYTKANLVDFFKEILNIYVEQNESKYKYFNNEHSELLLAVN